MKMEVLSERDEAKIFQYIKKNDELNVDLHFDLPQINVKGILLNDMTM